MGPHLDTCYAALKVERELALRRAAHRAPLLEAAAHSRSAPAGVRVGPALARGGRLVRAVRVVRRVLRPAPA